MREALLGITLGWAAGISPGPMLSLVMITTLRSGLGSGLRMAMVPLVSDAPVVIVSTMFAARIPRGFLTVLGVVGGGYLLWLGATEMRHVRMDEPGDTAPVPMGRGVVVNLLSPHPWLFWLTVGGPILVTAWRRLPPAGVAFVVLFYLLIVGTKMAIAWITDRAGRRLGPEWHRRFAVVAGSFMVLLGGVLIIESVAVS